MECTIDGSNVKPLAKAIQVLARIGDDLYIEAAPTCLYFRTVNSSRSAYVCVAFESDFFVDYIANAEVKCKVSLKSCMTAFRSLPTLERTVEKCLLNTNELDCALLVQFYCKHDMVKNYHLPFIENETVQAAFQNQVFQCKLTAQTRLLIDGIQNFSNSVEEVTLTVHSDKVVLKNYIDEDLEQDKVVHTELMLEAQEFETFDIEDETEVTFCLKEFRAVMNFSEGFNVPVTISCQQSGRPIMFRIDGIPGLLADFVLATLASRDAVPSQSVGERHPANVIKLSARKEKKARHKAKQSSASSYVNNEDNHVGTDDVVAISSISAEQPCSSTKYALAQTFVADSPLRDDDENDGVNRDDDDDDDAIPSTPPKKRFRIDFLGLSQLSQYTSMAPDPDEVLAEASDNDCD